MLPTKLLEYVSMGIACIAPKTGTIARYFDNRMVEFFDAGNIDSLAAAIVALHADPTRRASLSREAWERFGARYTWTRHKTVYTQLVDGLLARRAR